MPDVLDSNQIRQYHEDGYLCVPEVLSSEELAELREVTDGFVEASRTISDHTEVYDLEPGHAADDPRVRRIKMADRHHDAYARSLRHPRILAIVAALIGPAIRHKVTKLNLKSPAFGSPVEWHQDWAFYPHTNDDLLAVGVCIDAMTEENGCLLVIPGSHKGPLYSHHQRGVFVGAITQEIALDAAVPVLVPAGGISIHHVRTLHGSAANTSASSRRLLLHELAAVDAMPLLGFDGLEAWNDQILVGEPIISPRVEQVPVIIPEPKPATIGSIYRIQEALDKRTYAVPGS